MKYITALLLLMSFQVSAGENSKDVFLFIPKTDEIFEVKTYDGKQLWCYVSDKLITRLTIKCFDKNFDKERK